MNIPDISKSQWRGNKYIKNKFPEFYKYLLDNYPEDILFAEKLYWWEHGIKTYPICETCGRRLKFADGWAGYGRFCCSKCANSNKTKKERCQRTCMDKYGVKNPSNLPEIRLRISNHHKLNHYFLKNSRKTMLIKYGVSNASQISNHKQKCIATNKKKIGVCWNTQLRTNKDKITNLANEKMFQKYPDAVEIKVIEGKRCIIFNCTEPCSHPCKQKKFPIQISTLSARKHNIKCPQKSNSKSTQIELIVRKILMEYGIKFITNTRKPLKKYELDIFIPSHNIAIEVNGMYYHSTKFRTKDYHKNKFNLCEQLGIRLLTLWEDEILKNPGIVREKIKYMLGMDSHYCPICNMSGSLDVPLNSHDSKLYQIKSKSLNEFWADIRTFQRSSSKLKGKYIYHIYGNEIANYVQTEEAAKSKD